MSERLKVVLTTEGTYPYYAGGVSTWADILVKRLPDVDFSVLAIMMHPFISAKFEIQPNVKDVINVPLWGIEEPTEYISRVPFYKVYRKKLVTREEVIEKQFLAIVETVLVAVYRQECELPRLGEALVQFHEFFETYDYHQTFRSRRLWDFSYRLMLDICKDKRDEPTLYNFVENLRWLYRFFISLLAPVVKADIYHSSAAAFCGLPCLVAKIKNGSRFFLTEHGVYVREQFLYCSREQMAPQTKEFLMGLIKLVARLNYFYADQISPVCAYNKRWETRFGTPEEKIKVIYNGIDPDKFRKVAVDRDRRPTVVMVARIEPLKDVETYIRACALVRERIPEVRFKLYGPVVDARYFERCVKLVQDLGLGGSFEFSGETSTPEVSNNEGDVVLLTSISEAFPFSVLEGMACEKPVISSDVGGTREVLEGYGYVVRPKCPEAFAEKVIHVLEHPAEAAEMGIEARQRILGGFTINDMIDNYRNAYHSLAGSRDA